VNTCTRQGDDPERFEVLAGLGVLAVHAGREVLLGRPQLIAERGVAISDRVAQRTEEMAAVGRTVILVAVGGVVEGMLVLEDGLREESRELVRRLDAMGIRTVLITGDNRATAERVATELGIAEVHAEVLPRQKVEIVKALQAAGRKVAFVGDGVNDGPALAVADVGIAMGLAGTDVAVETAEIALLSDDLSRLLHLLELSRQAIRAIKQNLVFSLGVLGIAVGLEIPGIINPVTGALLHELSSIPVIANSARLIGLKEASSKADTQPVIAAAACHSFSSLPCCGAISSGELGIRSGVQNHRSGRCDVSRDRRGSRQGK
jgi:Cd2+/Zn2+-exporting ATPase